MKRVRFSPSNDAEKILTLLPKECSCHMCTISKKDAIVQLGEKRFKEICKILNIYI